MWQHTQRKKYGLEGKILLKRYFGIEVIKVLTGYRGLSVLREKTEIFCKIEENL